MLDFDLPEELIEPYKEQIQEILSETGLILKKFNNEDQELLFNAATGFYNIGQFEKASLIYRSLVLAAPLNPCYWQSLSTALQMNKNYAEAINGWAILVKLEPENPLFYLRCGECLLLQGKIEEGKKALTSAKNLCNKEDKILKEINNLIDSWEVAR